MEDTVKPTEATDVNVEIRDDVALTRVELEKEKFADKVLNPKVKLNYWIAEYRNLNAAVTKFGEAVVLGLFNSALTAAQRNKAANNLPCTGNVADDYAKFMDLVNDKNYELLTKDQALAVIPGTREKSSPTALRKEANEFIKQASIAKANGDTKRSQELLRQAIANRAKAKAIEEAKDAEIMAKLAEGL